MRLYCSKVGFYVEFAHALILCKKSYKRQRRRCVTFIRNSDTNMEASTNTDNFTAGLQRLTTNMEASTSTGSVTAGPQRLTDVRAGTQDKKAVALGGERYLTTSDFKGKIYVHIRQYFTYPNAGTTPVATKKGIALTPEQWIVIHRKAHLVTETLKKLMESTHRISSGEKLKLVLSGTPTSRSLRSKTNCTYTSGSTVTFRLSEKYLSRSHPRAMEGFGTPRESSSSE